MNPFLEDWNAAALTTLDFFWKALWAFVLGYVVSGCIQVFVTRERMQRTMGEAGGKSVFLATFFGFISSSCSFAALAGAKSLLKKGAGLVPSLAFLLASTNLVIELGIIISIFLGWQFIVGEYVGGILLIGFTWVFVKLLYPKKMLEETRKRLEAENGGDEEEDDPPNWRERIRSLSGWEKVASKYFMEWSMVWKDVIVGFTVAGVISAFVPREFFETLFVGSGGDGEPGFLEVLAQVFIGPVAAFFTFIGSMGNIPLAALLFANGVSFAGIMAFIFSDLVVFPVLRVNAKFYGWKMALYVCGIFLMAIAASALVMHYGYAALGLLPDSAAGSGESARKEGGPEFEIDLTFWMNLVFLGITAALGWLKWRTMSRDDGSQKEGGSGNWVEKVLLVLAISAGIWLAGGLVVGWSGGCEKADHGFKGHSYPFPFAEWLLPEISDLFQAATAR